MSKFKVGDTVRVLDGKNIEGYAGGWNYLMGKYVGKVGKIVDYNVYFCHGVHLDLDDGYYVFDERCLELVKDDGVRAVLVPTVFTPKRIYKGKGKTVVLWADGTKTIVKRAEGEADNDYAAFTAALAIKVFGANSEVNRIVKRTEAAEKKKPKKATQTMTVYKVYRQVDLSQDGHGGSGYSEEEVGTFATMDEAVKFADSQEANAWVDYTFRKEEVPLK